MQVPTPDQIEKIRAGTHCWGARCQTCEELLSLSGERIYTTCSCGGCTIQQSGSGVRISGSSPRKTLLIDFSTGIEDGKQPVENHKREESPTTGARLDFKVKAGWIAFTAFLLLGAPFVVTLIATQALADGDFLAAAVLIFITWPVFFWAGASFYTYVKQLPKNGDR